VDWYGIEFKAGQLTYICTALYTKQIISKHLHIVTHKKTYTVFNCF